MLARLLRKDQKVTLQLRLGGRITKAPGEEHNVVGEIKGSEEPDEVVIVGGHLIPGISEREPPITELERSPLWKASAFSSSLASDRNARSVLFSLRAKSKGPAVRRRTSCNIKPNCLMFRRVLIHDVGAGKPTGFTVQGYSQWAPFLKDAMTPLADIGVSEIPIERHWDSDQDPFIRSGVPGFFLDQDITDYFASTHHSQTDMLNHVKPAEYLPSIRSFPQPSPGDWPTTPAASPTSPKATSSVRTKKRWLARRTRFNLIVSKWAPIEGNLGIC